MTGLRVLIGCETSGVTPGPNRARLRSRSYPGMMAAAAWQWAGPAEREAAHG